MRARRSRLLDSALMHASVIATRVLFDLVRFRDRRMRRALDGFEATYQFRSQRSARRLIFSQGRIRTRAGTVDAPDYEVELLDPLAVLRQIADDPNDVIRLLLESKVDQRGNTFFLFKYGYLWGLCHRNLLDLIQDLRRLLPVGARRAG